MRKSILAATTALAVSFTGISVAQAQSSLGSSDDAASTETTVVVTEETTANQDLSSQYLGSSLADQDPKEIREWIAVFSAIIGAMSTLYAFLDRL